MSVQSHWTDRLSSIRPVPFTVLLVILALTIAVGRVAAFHSVRNFVGQGYMYKELAVGLASGKGFIETRGPLQGQPTMRRPPLWPIILAVPMKVCPQCSPVAITQFATGVMHAGTAFGVALLVGMLTGSRLRMLLALVVTALLPQVQPLMLGGYCEPFAAALLTIGAYLLCRGAFFPAIFTLSFLPLVRPNFLPLWLIVMALIWWRQFRKRGPLVSGPKPWRLLAAAVLFYAPTAVWIVRNYEISGAFPFMSGTASMTLYGNYNPVSATPGPKFGTWISPEFIPGEKDAKIVSEVRQFQEYDFKGKQFIREHWKLVPVLMVVHVVRSILPSPADGIFKYLFWALRLLIYGGAFLALRRRSVPLNSWFGILLACCVLLTAISVILYSGETRYLYPQEILLLALAFTAAPRKAPLSRPAAADENRADEDFSAAFRQAAG